MTGFRLACARGASMARAGKNVNASMAAIVKLPDETVERLCAAYDHVWAGQLQLRRADRRLGRPG